MNNSSNDRPWCIAINGTVRDEMFEDEESANRHAMSLRKHPSDRIATFQPGSRRHQKAVASGAAPDPRAPRPEPRPRKKPAQEKTEKTEDTDPSNS